MTDHIFSIILRSGIYGGKSKTLISTLGLGIWVSLTEELIFRGFLLNQLQQDYLPWIAAAIASLGRSRLTIELK